MKVKFYGTRGSLPIASSLSTRFGGNTTSIRIFSECLRPGTILTVDAGSGFRPLAEDALKEGLPSEMVILFTHYHHDHTQGILLSPTTYMKNVDTFLYGPLESAMGPKEMMESIMVPPLFPVHFTEVRSHFRFQGMEFPKTSVIIFHPEGGHKIMNLADYEKRIRNNGYFSLGKGTYPPNECLVVTMYKSHHPEKTIVYRFDEHPTGKSFIFLTDHENEDGTSLAFKNHLKKADLLVMDSQYSREAYEKNTAGFGHGTPDYCVRIAEETGTKRLGLTHHDPGSSDEAIERITEEAKTHRHNTDLDIFACADYMEVEV